MEEVGSHRFWDLWIDDQDSYVVEKINCKDWGGWVEGIVDLNEGKGYYFICINFL